MNGRPLRLCVFGGTFDPVHVGHLVVAVNIRYELQLDRVLLEVANEPWQKTGERAVTPAEDRYAVVQAAVGDVEGVESSRLEIDRGGVSYTADTLEQLADEHPGVELFVAVGADVAAKLTTWERVDKVRELATLVVVNRPGTTGIPELPGWRATAVEVPALEVSSTDLRARVADGRPLDYLIPAEAVRCMRERGLYAGLQMTTGRRPTS